MMGALDDIMEAQDDMMGALDDIMEAQDDMMGSLDDMLEIAFTLFAKNQIAVI